nr:MAG TPA: hypothetical protein [Caudoviricetes sp.]
MQRREAIPVECHDHAKDQFRIGRYVLEDLHGALMEQAISYDIVAIVRADLWGVFFSPKDKVRNRQDVSSFLSFY